MTPFRAILVATLAGTPLALAQEELHPLVAESDLGDYELTVRRHLEDRGSHIWWSLVLAEDYSPDPLAYRELALWSRRLRRVRFVRVDALQRFSVWSVAARSWMGFDLSGSEQATELTPTVQEIQRTTDPFPIHGDPRPLRAGPEPRYGRCSACRRRP
jgi:Txe/YoeB family toxin of Txe-Axe toxin-antitoxin module